MPYSKAQRAKKRKYIRKRIALMRMPQRGVSLNYHKFRLTQTAKVATNIATQAHPAQVNFTLKCYNLLNNTYQQSITAFATRQTGLNDVTSLYNLFDNYRVQYCKISYIPRYDRGFVIGGAKETGGTHTGNTSAYIAYDVDDKNLDETPSQLSQRQSMKQVDLCRRWEYTWHPRRVNQVTDGGVILENGWLDKDKDPSYDVGEVQCRGAGEWAISGEPNVKAYDLEIGDLLIEYFVEFKNRR